MFVQLDGIESGAVRESRGPGRERWREGEGRTKFIFINFPLFVAFSSLGKTPCLRLVITLGVGQCSFPECP